MDIIGIKLAPGDHESNFKKVGAILRLTFKIILRNHAWQMIHIDGKKRYYNRETNSAALM